MSNTTHYENANFLRELAENLPAYCRKVTRTKLRCCNARLTKNWPGQSMKIRFAPK